MARHCSRCDLINPTEASHCDCGAELALQAPVSGQLALDPQSQPELQIITCASCGQRNRLRSAADLMKSRCAKCKEPFLQNAAASASEDDALNGIRLLRSDLLRSIAARPPKSSALYQKTWSAFEERLGNPKLPLPYREQLSFLSSRSDLSTVYEVLCATGFVSAWYEAHKDRHQQSRSIRETVEAVSKLGVPELVVQKQVRFFEKLFSEILLMRGEVRASSNGLVKACGVAVLTAAFMICLWIWAKTTLF